MAGGYARYNGLSGGSSGLGVTSLNALTGALTLTAGSGITITPTSATNLTIAATGLSAAIISINSDATAAQTLSVGTAGTDFAIVDAGSGSHVFNLPTASALNRGALSSADWNTFNSKQNALTIGNLTDVGTDGITVTGGTGAVIGSGTSFSQHVADATHNGYLSSTDWSTFNSKGTGTVTAVSIASANGFAGTSSGGATPALTLTTSITGLLKGNGTAISAASAGTDYSAGTSALTTGILKSTTSTGALTIAIAADFPTLNQNTSGTATNVTGVVALINGGTGTAAASANAAFNALSPMTTGGDIIYGGASGVATRLANGSSGQLLTSSGGTSAPTWTTVSSGASTVLFPPAGTKLGSGSGTYDLIYSFTITSGSATVGATYTNNSITYTVYATVSSSVYVQMSGSGAPLASGTLTKTGGTGDATLTFSANRAPLSLKITAIGGGGAGSGSGGGGLTGGTAGTDTTFSSFITAGKGYAPSAGGGTVLGGNGGVNSVSSPAYGPDATGGMGGSSLSPNSVSVYWIGGAGGNSAYGGGGANGTNFNAHQGQDGTGGGGGGAGTSIGTGVNPGAGGGAGGTVFATIPNPAATAGSFTYAVGAGGTGGTAGSSGFTGGNGGRGVIFIESLYQ